MFYYLLSVWKRNGEKSFSQCCSTSDDFDDLLYNMTLYRIADDEIYVISRCEDGNEKYQCGNVSCNWYFDKTRLQIVVENSIDKTIRKAIDIILEEQRKYK